MTSLCVLLICGVIFVQGHESIRTKRSIDDIIPDPTRCMPIYEEMYPSSESRDKDSPKEYYLTLTKVRRCSGYCHDERCSCQPVAKKKLKVQVPVAIFDKKKQKWGKPGVKTVLFDDHTSCKCQRTDTGRVFSPSALRLRFG